MNIQCIVNVTPWSRWKQGHSCRTRRKGILLGSLEIGHVTQFDYNRPQRYDFDGNPRPRAPKPFVMWVGDANRTYHATYLEAADHFNRRIK